MDLHLEKTVIKRKVVFLKLKISLKILELSLFNANNWYIIGKHAILNFIEHPQPTPKVAIKLQLSDF